MLWYKDNVFYPQGFYIDLNDLAPGEYCVTITDYCEQVFTQCYTVTEYPEILFTASIEETCPEVWDGEIHLSITNGDGPFDISWSNGSTATDLTELSAGDYEVTITDIYGCSKVESYEVEVHSIDVSATIEGACDQWEVGLGRISLSISGYSGGYSLLWDHEGLTNREIDGLYTGIYTVTITDAECSYIYSFEVPQLEYRDDPRSGSCYNDVSCGGTNLLLSYWTGISGHDATNNCFVRLNCGNGNHIDSPLGEETWINHDGVYNSQTDVVTCSKDKLCTINWSFSPPDGSAIYNVNEEYITEYDFHYAPYIKYFDQGESENCGQYEYYREYWCGGSLIHTKCISGARPIQNPENEFTKIVKDQVKVFPNPFTEKVVVEFFSEYESDYTIRIINSLGKEIFLDKFTTNKGVFQFPITLGKEFSSGIYHIALTDSNGSFKRFKIAKF